MEKGRVELPNIKLAGITVRTNKQTEANILTGKIFPTVQKYFMTQLAEGIPKRRKPGTTYCAYTDYESDHNGDYTYFIGEEVDPEDFILPEGLKTVEIDRQDYTKFTTGPGAMPALIVDAWHSIWKMSDEDLGGKRTYKTDFEIYDERAADHENIVLDIYIGVES